jgi:hypothetical protein
MYKTKFEISQDSDYYIHSLKSMVYSVFSRTGG